MELNARADFKIAKYLDDEKYIIVIKWYRIAWVLVRETAFHYEKHAFSNIQKLFPTKIENFQIIRFW